MLSYVSATLKKGYLFPTIYWLFIVFVFPLILEYSQRYYYCQGFQPCRVWGAYYLLLLLCVGFGIFTFMFVWFYNARVQKFIKWKSLGLVGAVLFLVFIVLSLSYFARVSGDFLQLGRYAALVRSGADIADIKLQNILYVHREWD
jgi:hypothetical protein